MNPKRLRDRRLSQRIAVIGKARPLKHRGTEEAEESKELPEMPKLPKIAEIERQSL
jgi:hypothetical protein